MVAPGIFTLFSMEFGRKKRVGLTMFGSGLVMCPLLSGGGGDALFRLAKSGPCDLPGD